jgi:hypothetical protein
LTHWDPPRWDQHFATVDRFIAGVAASPAGASLADAGLAGTRLAGG